jgi:tetratricopeptide (TPR) repeat protein
LNASVRDDTVPRKVWLILDALNEADRFEDLLTALDKFLPNLPRFPWLKLIVSIRSGAYHALNRRHADLARAGANFLENEHHFFTFKSRDSDKIVPYLEVKPFEMEEAALAHQLRQQRFPAISVKAAWTVLSEPVRELLLNPLHLHLFHETFGSSSVHPDDLDADSLLNAYLDHLCDQNPGLERTLQQIGTLIFESRVPALPVATADAWLDEWRRAGSVAGRSAKLNPIEELVSASLLLRPAEHGIGMNRQLAAFQFRHQKLCEQVLLRELRRQIHPRKLPTGEELTAWVEQIAGPAEDAKEPFNELLGAVQSMLKDVILAGAADVFTTLFRVEPETVRTRVIFGGLLKSRLDRREDALEVFLGNLTAHLDGNRTIAENSINALGDPLEELAARSMTLPARRFWEALLTTYRSLVDAEPQRADLRKGLSRSLHQLGSLAHIHGDSRNARKFFEEVLVIIRALVDTEPHSSDLREALSMSMMTLGSLARTEGDSQIAQKFLEEALAINRAVVDAEPNSADLNLLLSESLHHLGGLAETEGNSRSARSFFEEAFAINHALVDAEPHRTDLRRGLSRSLNHLSGLAGTEGDSRTARELSEEALAINRALVEAEPHRTDLRQELSVSLIIIGGLAQTEGDNQIARKFFEEAFAINRALVQTEPHRADLMEGLFASLTTLGRLAYIEGDSQTAREFVQEAVAIIRALVDAEPHRADRRELLSASLKHLGELADTDNDSRTARQFFEEALLIDRALVDKEPHRTDLREKLFWSLSQLGRLANIEGESRTARQFFEEALPIIQALFASDPHRADRMELLSASLKCLGELADTEDDSRTARKFFEEALPIDRALVDAEPQVSDLKNNLCGSLNRLADFWEMEGNNLTASALLEESLQIKRALLAQTEDDPDLTAEIMDLERRIRSLQ